MSTLALNTTARATSNPNRVNLYKEDSPFAILDYKEYPAPHAERVWIFTDLVPGENYFYRWIEVDNNGNTLQQYASQHFTVPAYGALKVKAPIEWVTNITPGFISGTNTATFDGTNGTEDLRGWEIDPNEPGLGPFWKDHVGDLGYSWDKNTGTFTLLQPGLIFDVFERIHVTFLPKVIASSPPNLRDAWNGDIYITTTYQLLETDFGKNAIVDGEPYIKITLPDINTVAPGRLLYVECGGNTKCAEFICGGGNSNIINYPKPGKNSLFICTSETLAIYRRKVSNVLSVWCVKFADGNFKTVGEHVTEYQTDVINKVPLTNAIYNKNSYARLYDYILSLPPLQVVAFGDWQFITNRYRYSTADANGDFHVPDFSGKYERPTAGEAAGAYLLGSVGPHTHPVKVIYEGNDGSPFNKQGQVLRKSDADTGAGTEQAGSDINNYAIESNTGTENMPNSIIVNMYVRV
jgi:hypothetical protein